MALAGNPRCNLGDAFYVLDTERGAIAVAEIKFAVKGKVRELRRRS